MHLLAEKPDYLRTSSNHSDLEVSNGSYIKLFVNGVEQPMMFQDIYEGPYFAAVSLYMHASCRLNLGPSDEFKFRPSDPKVQAYSKLADSVNAV